MKTGATLLLLLASLLGCSKGDPNLPGYELGSGDVTSFVLQSALFYGARPRQTNGLPQLKGDWRYKADKDGIQIHLVGDRFADVRSLLLAAFGTPAIAPKTNADGQIANGVYAAPTLGAAIQFGHEERFGGTRYTEVVIARAEAFK